MRRIVPCIVVSLLIAGCNGPAPTVVEGKRLTPEKPAWREIVLGEKLFDQYCKICHDMSPHSLGAPSLTRRRFRYGRTVVAVKATINAGRPKGMPAFKGDFNEVQLNALTTYVLSLSR